MNLEALKTIQVTFMYLSVASFLTSSQFWLYRKGYKNGYEIGKHTGFTEGLFRGQKAPKRNLSNKSKSLLQSRSLECKMME
jgi:hypothetical protein